MEIWRSPCILRTVTLGGTMIRCAFLLPWFAVLAGCQTTLAEPGASAQQASSAAAIAADVATITALEDRWSQAFLTKDIAFLEQIVAPEFEVHGWRGGRYLFTGRARWMEGARQWGFIEHPSKVLHVRVYGDTAVATVKGKLLVERNGRQIRNNEWVVTDTWLRRNGRWQVVFRYADTLAGTCKVGCGGMSE
jgi:hypothetical protein